MTRRVNRDDLEKFHDYSLHIPSRTIYLGSEHVGDPDFAESGIEATSAERQIKNLHILNMISQEDITIILNSIGGDVAHGLAIYDAIKASKSKITIKAFGNVMSMGSVIFQSANERIMSPNCVQMIHAGHMSVDQHVRTVYRAVEESKRIDKWTEAMYLERIKEKQPLFTLQRLQRMLDHDTFLTAQQSKDLGLCDKVLGEE